MRTMKADNEATLAKNETAIERLVASNERFRTDTEKAIRELRADIERRSRVLLLEVACVVGGVVAVISFIIGLIFS